ncbi:MAG: 50S ribosomal protein L31 [Candidatus Riflebacteria bacterium RBG_13_59_9]|nr:MAG: 50S ribosomal protein L31 [Candidatus Riflebacteria bacterium RBG_13_59_9]
MKKGIHPEVKLVTVTCACGETFKALSVREEIKVEICSKCHPFYTGQRKIVDTAGRVEKFIKRAAKAMSDDDLKKQKKKKR